MDEGITKHLGDVATELELVGAGAATAAADARRSRAAAEVRGGWRRS